MDTKRMAMFGSLLAAAVAVLVTGVAARPDDGDRVAALSTAERGVQDRADRADRADRQDRRERTVAPPSDRRVIRLEGRGSQLGVTVSDADDPARPGVRIDAVDNGSAAAKAGAKEGDVVVEFDGERVRSARQLTRLVQETPAGRTVKMTVLRGTAKQTLDVTPDEREGFAWNGREFGIDLEREIERGLDQGLRDVPGRGGPMFDFRLDGRVPGMARGRLGVQVESLSDQLAGYFGATNGGVLVSSVTEESPAEKAGLKAGDVITAVNGKTVRQAGELVDELSDAKDGAEVTLGIVREKKASTVRATIDAPRRERSRRSTRP